MKRSVKDKPLNELWHFLEIYRLQLQRCYNPVLDAKVREIQTEVNRRN